MSALISGRLAIALSSVEICLLNCLYNARDDLRQLMQRWDNRSIVENISLAEEYAKGRLSIVCYVEICRSSYRLDSSAISDSETCINDLIVVIVMRAYSGQLCDGNNRDQQSMLVNDVESVKGPQEIIPSFVWFDDIGNQIADILPGHVYLPTVDRCYEFFPCVTDRETGIPGWDIPGFGNNLTGHKVQGGTQIMDDVTNNQGNLGWQRIGIERQNIVPSEVLIDMQTVKVSFEECAKARLKILDVAVGPFDL